MKRIVLISCVSKKLARKSKAKDLYISPLFKMNMEYTRSLNPDKIFILSAKYGLLNLDDEIEPYNETLNEKSVREIKAWSEIVIKSLGKEINITEDEVIFLAGAKYRKYLIPHIKNYRIPLKGLTIGKQLKYLKERINNE